MSNTDTLDTIVIGVNGRTHMDPEVVSEAVRIALQEYKVQQWIYPDKPDVRPNLVVKIFGDDELKRKMYDSYFTDDEKNSIEWHETKFTVDYTDLEDALKAKLDSKIFKDDAMFIAESQQRMGSVKGGVDGVVSLYNTGAAVLAAVSNRQLRAPMGLLASVPVGKRNSQRCLVEDAGGKKEMFEYEDYVLHTLHAVVRQHELGNPNPLIAIADDSVDAKVAAMILSEFKKEVACPKFRLEQGVQPNVVFDAVEQPYDGLVVDGFDGNNFMMIAKSTFSTLHDGMKSLLKKSLLSKCILPITYLASKFVGSKVKQELYDEKRRIDEFSRLLIGLITGSKNSWKTNSEIGPSELSFMITGAYQRATYRSNTEDSYPAVNKAFKRFFGAHAKALKTKEEGIRAKHEQLVKGLHDENLYAVPVYSKKGMRHAIVTYANGNRDVTAFDMARKAIRGVLKYNKRGPVRVHISAMGEYDVKADNRAHEVRELLQGFYDYYNSDACTLLHTAPLEYAVGYGKSDSPIKGASEVYVCDGRTGNILLNTARSARDNSCSIFSNAIENPRKKRTRIFDEPASKVLKSLIKPFQRMVDRKTAAYTRRINSPSHMGRKRRENMVLAAFDKYCMTR
jgi:fatty acid/phospholipid biosynthesis enzyme